jgi:hypothetical protein
MTIADGVEFAQGRDALLKNAVATLFVDVLGRVTGQRRDDLDLVPG